MGIHCELIYEVVNRLDILLEGNYESYTISPYNIEEMASRSKKFEILAPDILVYFRDKQARAIEIESDTGFDFDQSMRQIQKYKKKYRAIVVIPKMHEKYASLYENDNIKTFLWSGSRIWQCYNCKEEIHPEKGETGYSKPKCTKCNTNEVRLYRIKNFVLTRANRGEDI